MRASNRQGPVQRGKDPIPTLNDYFGRAAAAARGTGAPIGHTLASYVRDVFLPYNQSPRVRKAQARDYRRHLRIVVARLGDLPLAGFEPRDIRGLQAELLDRGLSPKYVKNILSGSLRALIAQALDDKALPADPFPRRLKCRGGNHRARIRSPPMSARRSSNGSNGSSSGSVPGRTSRRPP